MKRFKDLDLFIQVSLVITSVSVLISLVMLVFLPATLKGFFTEEIYKNIEAAQSSFIAPSGWDQARLEDIRAVKHVLVYQDGHIESQEVLPANFLNDIRSKVSSYPIYKNRFSFQEGAEQIFYTMKKIKVQEDYVNLTSIREAYLISYLTDSYRDTLVGALYRKILELGLIVILASLVPSLILSKYISKPISNLRDKVGLLALGDWSGSIDLDRQDEIGQLGESVEKLRLELIRQDRMRNNFLQDISHGLKTPIMVIQSYSQAIKDGIYPNGDLVSSLDIIGEEAGKLEEKVGSLIYLSKLDFIRDFSPTRENFSLDKLLEELVVKYRGLRPDLDFCLQDFSMIVYGNQEQISLVFENILDNMLRYARSKILIRSLGNKIEIYNDGPGLEDGVGDRIFNKFYKGPDGDLGLGLNIARKILTSHGFKIFVENKPVGVSFYIEFKEVV